jgi:hypothetical protein
MPEIVRNLKDGIVDSLHDMSRVPDAEIQHRRVPSCGTEDRMDVKSYFNT